MSCRVSFNGGPPFDQNALQPNDPHPDPFELLLDPELLEKAENCFSTSLEPHAGHVTGSLPERTSSSKFSSHLQHLYSNIGIQISPFFRLLLYRFRSFWFILFMPVPGITGFSHSGRDSRAGENKFHYKDPGRKEQ